MTTYQSTKKSEISNRVVEELNAAVLSATFEKKDGEQLADLYTCRNQADCIVAHGKCGPINGTFSKTIKIMF